MLQTLKFNTRDQGVFFSSDFHWSHDPKWEIPIWRQRGFSSLQESNEYIINKTNEVVGRNDLLFHLGDISLNCSENEFENFIRRLNCQNIFLLNGNHNSPAKNIYHREVGKLNLPNDMGLKFGAEIYPFVYKNVIFIGDYLEMIINGQMIMCFHYPVSIHNQSKNGSWMLCGHSHHGYSKSLPSHKEGKILDVGFDGFKRPLSFQEIKSIMDTKDIAKGLDKHH